MVARPALQPKPESGQRAGVGQTLQLLTPDQKTGGSGAREQSRRTPETPAQVFQKALGVPEGSMAPGACPLPWHLLPVVICFDRPLNTTQQLPPPPPPQRALWGTRPPSGSGKWATPASCLHCSPGGEACVQRAGRRWDNAARKGCTTKLMQERSLGKRDRLGCVVQTKGQPRARS